MFCLVGSGLRPWELEPGNLRFFESSGEFDLEFGELFFHPGVYVSVLVLDEAAGVGGREAVGQLLIISELPARGGCEAVGLPWLSDLLPALFEALFALDLFEPEQLVLLVG